MDELHLCGDFNNQTNIDEKRLIPHIKRFMECAVGDPEFYEAIHENAAGCAPLLQSKGIFGVDPVQAAALVPDMLLLKEVPVAELEGKPQALLWRRYTDAIDQYRITWRQCYEKTPSNLFNTWRQRQINRCHSQLSEETNKAIIHTTIAFELSKGCSMGCPFCGVAAEPLQEVFMYTKENARLWQDVLNAAVEHLGTTVGSGVCYWATEPSDNPDYFRFVADFGKTTGVYPHTTIAAPMRNLEWTREMLRFRREHIMARDSFSILSTNTLHRIHETFSAEELALTVLAMQHSASSVSLRAQSGRNRKAASDNPQLESAQDHTIACLTGYLVNMVDRSVRLISPCPPSNCWPLGYQVYAEGNFSCAAELDDFIRETMDKCMPEQVASDDILAFRRDLEFIPLPEEGFQLLSKYQLHKMTGSPHLSQLGQLISHRNLTFWQVIEELVVQHKDALAIMASIQKLFDQGLLDDGLSEEGLARR
ncbi:radical SAM family RiPP maturation amino acid epimerase [Desulfosporosinus lacus]|uniref:Radical SAM family RiPP maturation amino acid epimerase n=1 Tax=Desulfosporosinus lacus DSM 15449 TaxID=1121420 RepID=A0A1M5QWT1_9FIRM|nr:radical SAM family RiPP maturation amino acid epimerase [Desulfosporosinus lacus]SHH18346.1 radical SAM family RiPP maturation amino acid epimerase [Desulfosporosinus lacus DSM 15449]